MNKILKKAISLTAAIAMLVSTTVFASAPVVTCEPTSWTLEISGTSEAADNTKVAVYVLKPGASVDAVQAAIANGEDIMNYVAGAPVENVLVKSNAYATTVTLPADAADGTYIIVSSESDEVATYTFNNPGTRGGYMKEIILENSDAENMLAIMERAYDEVGMDAELYALLDDVKDVYAQVLVDDEKIHDLDPDDLNNIVPLIERLNKNALVVGANEGVLTGEKLEEHLDAINAGDYETAFAGEKSDAATKDTTVALMKGLVEKEEDLDTLFKKAVTVALATNPGDDAATTVVASLDALYENSGVDGFTEYNGLTSIEKVTLAAELLKTPPATIADFEKFVKDFATSSAAPTPTPTPSTSPSYGGSGSGSGTIITDNKVNDNDDDKETDGYIDIDNVKWAHEAIYALSGKGVFSGYGDKTFRPNNYIVREEFTKALAVAVYGLENVDMNAVPTFKDAQNGWYTPYLALAEKKGMTVGMGDGTFGIGQNIKRQDLALMLYRVLVSRGFGANTADAGIADAANISDYAVEAVNALKNAGIINGYEDGSFKPLANATRAETAVMIYNALVKIKAI